MELWLVLLSPPAAAVGRACVLLARRNRRMTDLTWQGLYLRWSNQRPFTSDEQGLAGHGVSQHFG